MVEFSDYIDTAVVLKNIFDSFYSFYLNKI